MSVSGYTRLTLAFALGLGAVFWIGATWPASRSDAVPVRSATAVKFPHSLTALGKKASPNELVPSLFRAYMHLRDIQFSYLDVQEHASDETMVPTRGPDWGDGGVWRELTQHEWTSDHPMLAGVWDFAYQGVHYANVVLPELKEAANRSGDPFHAQVVAEVRVLRALYFYTLLDLFGRVPLTTTRTASKAMIAPQETDVEPETKARKEVFSFVRSELNTAIESGNLPSAQNYGVGRVTESAANAFLARLLINGEIYTGEVRGGFSPGNSFYPEAEAAANRVLNSGHFALEDDYYANFAADNHASSEIIFAVPYEAEQGEGYVKTQAVLHYNHPLPTTPWNGFTTIASFYKSFNTDPGSDGKIGTQDDVHNDVRGKQFLVGKQWSKPSEGCAADNCFSDNTSSPITVRGSDTQVNFTLGIPALSLSGDAADLENPGARPMKFEVDPNAAGFHMGNDYPLVRLAEMYLIKAEAEFQQGNLTAAVAALNDIRLRSEAETVDPANVNREDVPMLILQERGREFHFEMLRRQDLIRYEFAYGGADSDDPYAPTFTGPWLFKDASSEYRMLFPIPQKAINANSNLTQNPGY